MNTTAQNARLDYSAEVYIEVFTNTVFIFSLSHKYLSPSHKTYKAYLPCVSGFNSLFSDEPLFIIQWRDERFNDRIHVRYQ